MMESRSEMEVVMAFSMAVFREVAGVCGPGVEGDMVLWTRWSPFGSWRAVPEQTSAGRSRAGLEGYWGFMSSFDSNAILLEIVF